MGASDNRMMTNGSAPRSSALRDLPTLSGQYVVSAIFNKYLCLKEDKLKKRQIKHTFVLKTCIRSIETRLAKPPTQYFTLRLAGYSLAEPSILYHEWVLHCWTNHKNKQMHTKKWTSILETQCVSNIRERNAALHRTPAAVRLIGPDPAAGPRGVDNIKHK